MGFRLLAIALGLAAGTPSSAGFEQLSRIRSMLKPAVEQLAWDRNLLRTISSQIK